MLDAGETSFRLCGTALCRISLQPQPIQPRNPTLSEGKRPATVQEQAVSFFVQLYRVWVTCCRRGPGEMLGGPALSAQERAQADRSATPLFLQNLPTSTPNTVSSLVSYSMRSQLTLLSRACCCCGLWRYFCLLRSTLLPITSLPPLSTPSTDPPPFPLEKKFPLLIAMSDNKAGTIPSMEGSHVSLDKNTLIVGASFPPCESSFCGRGRSDGDGRGRAEG